jgi:hypothetical protein
VDARATDDAVHFQNSRSGLLQQNPGQYLMAARTHILNPSGNDL